MRRYAVLECRRHCGLAVFLGFGRIKHVGQSRLPSSAWLGIRGRRAGSVAELAGTRAARLGAGCDLRYYWLVDRRPRRCGARSAAAQASEPLATQPSADSCAHTSNPVPAMSTFRRPGVPERPARLDQRSVDDRLIRHGFVSSCNWAPLGLSASAVLMTTGISSKMQHLRKATRLRRSLRLISAAEQALLLVYEQQHSVVQSAWFDMPCRKVVSHRGSLPIGLAPRSPRH